MAANDWVTVAEAKTHLNISVATWDAELGLYVTAISERGDDLVGPVVQRTVTDELVHGGRDHILLRHAPVASITSVAEYSATTERVLTASSNTSQPTDAYLVDRDAGIIWRRSGAGGAVFPAGVDNVKVTYVAGRFANTAAVGSKFKLAALRWLATIWRHEQGGRTPLSPEAEGFGPPAFAVPHFVTEMLEQEMRAPVMA